MDIALTILEIKGVDAKALRAFRVLRPLRFLSGIPSKSTVFSLFLSPNFYDGIRLEIFQSITQ